MSVNLNNRFSNFAYNVEDCKRKKQKKDKQDLKNNVSSQIWETFWNSHKICLASGQKLELGKKYSFMSITPWTKFLAKA